MIIDTTVSIMEDKMDKLRRLDEHVKNKFCKRPGWHWPADRRARAQYRESAIRDFLIKQGKDPGQLNYLAFWENGEIIGVHHLGEFGLSPAEMPKTKTTEEKEYEEHLQKMINKFVNFMEFGILNSQRNPKLSK